MKKLNFYLTALLMLIGIGWASPGWAAFTPSYHFFNKKGVNYVYTNVNNMVSYAASGWARTDNNDGAATNDWTKVGVTADDPARGTDQITEGVGIKNNGKTKNVYMYVTGVTEVTAYVVSQKDDTNFKLTANDGSNTKKSTSATGANKALLSATITDLDATKNYVLRFNGLLNDSNQDAALVCVACTSVGRDVTTYTITTSTNPEGAGVVVVKDGNDVEEGTDAVLTATANPGYKFLNWTIDGTTTVADNPTTIANVTAAHTAVANFDVLPKITFSKGDDTEVIGLAPDVDYAEGTYTLPKAPLMAKPGYTLTAWNDGTTDHAIGSTITVSADVNLTPVFTQNTVSVADTDAEVSATWNFGPTNGAPTMAFEKGNLTYPYVTPITIKGQTIDLCMTMDPTGGKINNVGRTDALAQTNGGTKLTVPVTKGSVITIKSYRSSYSSTENAAQTTFGDYAVTSSDVTGSGNNWTTTYTYNGTESELLITLQNVNYTECVTVTYPAPQTAAHNPTITVGAYRFEHHNTPVTITAVEGETLYVSVDGATATVMTSPAVVTPNSTVSAYAKVNGLDNSETVTATVASYDASKKYVAWVYQADYNNNNFEDDKLVLGLKENYNVVPVAYASTDGPSDDWKKADLIVVTEMMSGGSTLANGMKDFVGVKPMINLKAFNYNTAKNRWNWGEPNNPAKDADNVSVTVTNKNYKLFDGCEIADDGTMVWFDATANGYEEAQNHVQYTSITDETVLAGSTVMATFGGDANVSMHTYKNDYVFIGLSCDNYASYGANAILLVKNAAAMLLAGEDLDAVNEVTPPTPTVVYPFVQETTEVTDELTSADLAATSNSYAAFTDVNKNTEAVYAGQTAKANNPNKDAIQMKSGNNNTGIVSTVSGGKVKKVAVTWNSGSSNGTLDIYGSNDAYSAATELYGKSLKGTKLGSIVNGTSTELEIEGDYAYLGLRSNNGAIYIDKIEITWAKASGEASPVAAPTFSVAAGTYTEVQTVAITAEDGAEIYYVTDDETELSSEATKYTEPIAVGETTTIKAFAVKDGKGSVAVTAAYVINLPVSVDVAGYRAADDNATVTINVPLVQVAQNGNQHFLVDADNNGVLVYDSNLGAIDAGTKILTGLTGTKVTYNAAPELTNIVAETFVTDGTVEALVGTETEIADLTADKLYDLVRISGEITAIEGTTYTIKNGADEITVVDKFGVVEEEDNLAVGTEFSSIDGIVYRTSADKPIQLLLVGYEAVTEVPTYTLAEIQKLNLSFGESVEANVTLENAKITYVNEGRVFMEDEDVAVMVQDDNSLLQQGTAITGTVPAVAFNAGTGLALIISDITGCDVVDANVNTGKVLTSPAQLSDPANIYRLVTVNATEEYPFGEDNESGCPTYGDNFVVDAFGVLTKEFPEELGRVTGIVMPMEAVAGEEGGEPAQVVILAPRSDDDILDKEAATAISNAASAAVSNGAVYNLAGQKVSSDFKGIVIKNGKKAVVK